MGAVDPCCGGEDPERLQPDPLEALPLRLLHELADEPPADSLPADGRVEEEPTECREPVALVGQRGAAGELAVALDDPDGAAALRPAAIQRAVDRCGHVLLHSRAEIVLTPVEDAVHVDDRVAIVGRNSRRMVISVPVMSMAAILP